LLTLSKRLASIYIIDTPRSNLRLTLALGIVIGLLLLVAGVYGMRQYRESHRFDVYTREFGDIACGWKWISSNVSGAKIALAGAPLFYPLYGNLFGNEVQYINITGDLNDRHHDFYARGESYRNAGDPNIWLENLMEWGADYFVVQALPGQLKPEKEDEWIQEHPGIFQLVYTNSQIDIYVIADDLHADS
jgi:hypothetical protein